MKTLDLNAYGVYGMNAEEMMDVDGGGLFGGLLLVVGLAVTLIAIEYDKPRIAAAATVVAAIGLALV
ncbi:MAG: hypothetical protein LBF67_08395 [Prevotellaceae bacterium]|nr:hypothetical protein [Prevotellaceae bacterium]